MEEMTKQFLKLFYNEGEEICVSDCAGAYHSIEQNKLGEDFLLISPKEGKEPRLCDEHRVILSAINPINGWRRDENVTAYRTFMIECDDMPLKKQWEYVNKMKFPFSYCCYSGGKSLHFALVLDEDIVSENVYKFTYEWILNIMKEADQQTKNPSRSVRFPGNIRRETGKKQKLLHMGERISPNKLRDWLNMFPNEKPIVKEKVKIKHSVPNYDGIKPWAKKALAKGVHNLDGSRNQTWMAIGCEFALNGYDLDDTIYILEQHFEEQHDFKKNEWETAVTSGWNYSDKIAE